ncbi:hypothetical protein [Streptomyces sp. NPDC058157]|uniref:HflX-like GTP-binding protein n=1 Tax=Streptomyces sp. NPDC058157 TaxID=3346360 RepID=UPI0036E7A1AC
MHQPRRRDRRPAPRVPSQPSRPRQECRLTAVGADVVLVGLFSAKQKDFETLMSSAAAELAARGTRVVARIVQRRGVSHGGVRKMSLPFSSRTLLSSGKVREVARACDQAAADAVIFVNTLTTHQQRILTVMLGCPALDLTDIVTDG